MDDLKINSLHSMVVCQLPGPECFYLFLSHGCSFVSLHLPLLVSSIIFSLFLPLLFASFTVHTTTVINISFPLIIRHDILFSLLDCVWKCSAFIYTYLNFYNAHSINTPFHSINALYQCSLHSIHKFQKLQLCPYLSSPCIHISYILHT